MSKGNKKQKFAMHHNVARKGVNIPAQPVQRLVYREEVLSFAERMEKFKKEKGLERLNVLASLIYLLKSESYRVVGDITCLLERYGLNMGDIKRQVEMLEKSEDRFFEFMKELLRQDADNFRQFREDSDRFDRDFYRYMGVKKVWNPKDSPHTSVYIGVQNFMSLGNVDAGKGMCLYIGRNRNGELWVSADEKLERKIGLDSNWFNEIGKGEYYLMEVTPKLYVDSY